MVGVTSTLNSFHLGCALMTREDTDTYSWVLQQVKGVCVHVPTTIVTDRELGLMKALENVFPEAKHMLCEWHVLRNIEGMALRKTAQIEAIQSRFCSQAKRLIRSGSEQTYHRRLAAMKVEWGTKYGNLMGYFEDTWLVHREKLVYCWANQNFHLGNHCTSR